MERNAELVLELVFAALITFTIGDTAGPAFAMTHVLPEFPFLLAAFSVMGLESGTGPSACSHDIHGKHLSRDCSVKWHGARALGFVVPRIHWTSSGPTDRIIRIYSTLALLVQFIAIQGRSQWGTITHKRLKDTVATNLGVEAKSYPPQVMHYVTITSTHYAAEII